jgi:hypothetical protein
LEPRAPQLIQRLVLRKQYNGYFSRTQVLGEYSRAWVAEDSRAVMLTSATNPGIESSSTARGAAVEPRETRGRRYFGHIHPLHPGTSTRYIQYIHPLHLISNASTLYIQCIHPLHPGRSTLFIQNIHPLHPTLDAFTLYIQYIHPPHPISDVSTLCIQYIHPLHVISDTTTLYIQARP